MSVFESGKTTTIFQVLETLNQNMWLALGKEKLLKGKYTGAWRCARSGLWPSAKGLKREGLEAMRPFMNLCVVTPSPTFFLLLILFP